MTVDFHSKGSINLAISLEKAYFIYHPSLSLSLSFSVSVSTLSLFLYLSKPISPRSGICWEKRSSSYPTSDLGWLSPTPFYSLFIMKSSLLCLWNTLGIPFVSVYVTDNCFLYEPFFHQHYFFFTPLTFSTIGSRTSSAVCCVYQVSSDVRWNI